MAYRSDVHRITAQIPEDVICARLGVKPRTIRQAREKRFFPASWFPVILDLCREYRLGPPAPDAFSFKRAATDERTPDERAACCLDLGAVEISMAHHASEEFHDPEMCAALLRRSAELRRGGHE